MFAPKQERDWRRFLERQALRCVEFTSLLQQSPSFLPGLQRMDYRALPRVLPAILVTAALAACTSKAPDTSSVTHPLALPEPASASTASGVSPGAATANVATTPIPVATDDIWKALDKQNADLDSAISNNAWKKAQGDADAIRDLTGALPAHASKLSADAQTKLQQDVAFIASYAGKLDEAANAGDAGAAKKNYKKLNDVLGGITRFP
jgi:hypothetical protein